MLRIPENVSNSPLRNDQNAYIPRAEKTFGDVKESPLVLPGREAINGTGGKGADLSVLNSGVNALFAGFQDGLNKYEKLQLADEDSRLSQAQIELEKRSKEIEKEVADYAAKDGLTLDQQREYFQQRYKDEVSSIRDKNAFQHPDIINKANKSFSHQELSHFTHYDERVINPARVEIQKDILQKVTTDTINVVGNSGSSQEVLDNIARMREIYDSPAAAAVIPPSQLSKMKDASTMAAAEHYINRTIDRFGRDSVENHIMLQGTLEQLHGLIPDDKRLILESRAENKIKAIEHDIKVQEAEDEHARRDRQQMALIGLENQILESGGKKKVSLSGLESMFNNLAKNADFADDPKALLSLRNSYLKQRTSLIERNERENEKRQDYATLTFMRDNDIPLADEQVEKLAKLEKWGSKTPEEQLQLWARHSQIPKEGKALINGLLTSRDPKHIQAGVGLYNKLEAMNPDLMKELSKDANSLIHAIRAGKNVEKIIEDRTTLNRIDPLLKNEFGDAVNAHAKSRDGRKSDMESWLKDNGPSGAIENPLYISRFKDELKKNMAVTGGNIDEAKKLTLKTLGDFGEDKLTKTTTLSPITSQKYRDHYTNEPVAIKPEWIEKDIRKAFKLTDDITLDRIAPTGVVVKDQNGNNRMTYAITAKDKDGEIVNLTNPRDPSTYYLYDPRSDEDGYVKMFNEKEEATAKEKERLAKDRAAQIKRENAERERMNILIEQERTKASRLTSR